jgi:hypothetical protein
MSFSYGDIPAGPVGELGAGRGLRVCFRTFTFDRVEVWYGSALLHVSPAAAGSSLRSNQLVEVRIGYNPSGLTVVHAGVVHVDQLAIPQWAPVQGWRFALGARSGGESDDHHVDDLVIDAGSALLATDVPVALSLNGVQFTREDIRFRYERETSEEAGFWAVSPHSTSPS